jgi:hypothetical protein
MIVYVLYQRRDELVNVTGVFDTLKAAEEVKVSREELEKDWVLYDRFEYTIEEVDVLQLIRDSI